MSRRYRTKSGMLYVGKLAGRAPSLRERYKSDTVVIMANAQARFFMRPRQPGPPLIPAASHGSYADRSLLQSRYSLRDSVMRMAVACLLQGGRPPILPKVSAVRLRFGKKPVEPSRDLGIICIRRRARRLGKVIAVPAS